MSDPDPAEMAVYTAGVLRARADYYAHPIDLEPDHGEGRRDLHAEDAAFTAPVVKPLPPGPLRGVARDAEA